MITRKLITRTTAAFLAIGLAASITACSSGGSNPGGSNTGGSNAGNQTLTIVSYSPGPDKKAREQFVADEFMKANPGTTVTVTLVPSDNYDSLIRSEIQAGKSPDLFEVLNNLSGLQPYVDAGLLQDLSDQPWVSRQVSGVQATKSYFGKVYQYTAELNAIGVIYNKDIFAKYNVSVPTTWEEFQADIAKFKAAGVIPLATGAKDGWPLPVQLEGMVVQNTELAVGTQTASQLQQGTLAFSKSQAWSEALNDFQGMVKEGAFDPQASGVTWPDSAAQMANGKAAMMIQATFAFPLIRQNNANVNLGMFPLPYKEPVVGFGLGAMLAMPKSGNTALAEKFLNFFSSASVMSEWVQKGASISPFTDVTSATDPASDDLITALQKSGAEYNISTGIAASTAAVLTPGLQGIVAGNETAAGLLQKLDAAQKQ